VNKVALITGASGGLGQQLCQKLLNQDWSLILVGRNGEKLKSIYADKHIQIAGDCSQPDGVAQIFHQIKALQLIPTALAHCVGNIRLGAIHRMSQQDFHECLSANLLSAYYTLAAYIDLLKSNASSGSAVFVSSAAASIGTPNHEAIALSKSGLEGLVRGAAATYANQSIRINAVSPGIMDTMASADLLGSELMREIAAKQYPLKGIGQTTDVADLMAWLLSDSANRVTGQVWSIDGGFSSIRPIVK